MTGQGGPKTLPAAYWQAVVARWLLQLNTGAVSRPLYKQSTPVKKATDVPVKNFKNGQENGER
jgi:hypothetical protein